MWLFISRRLRSWLLLAIALPLLRRLIRLLSNRAAARDPQSTASRGLRRADTALGSLSRRRGR